ncbi:MAG: nucleoside transporter C-terminal domain-containing protein [Vicinamibacterales bacterium]|mgnify:FL=1|jgi:CNT family concentrative nucleoside transporter|nr:nucleoside transporter C-terminal domain-containing protein [Vicinamibacterales bacterium]HJO18137.1 nucleoside transporter C-terminal domain-containing protein [Vicinamibacterales bacterium]|tara:strand:- start:101081 stop:102415 length:1335 start_codon:yes stop_codon:yes gene_type:complete
MKMLSNPDQRYRLRFVAIALGLMAVAYLLRDLADPRVRAVLGVAVFISVTAACSADIRHIRWRTVAWGLSLQVLLAFVILKLVIGGVRPGYELFTAIARVAERFMKFTDAGSRFIFGELANPEVVSQLFPGGFVFAFTALPIIIFISSFFSVLYHFGILQFFVKQTARIVVYLLNTSGAETLSAVANVFMGQTEAPIIVRPYVSQMTRSELLTLMVGGMATISGAVMAIYINLGADAVAMLTTSVMAAPCGLYLSKILMPESEVPKTRGAVTVDVKRQYANVIDAAAGGASQGMTLAINVAAMLIAFLAFIALIDYVLALLHPALSLASLFSVVFAPAAFLLGVASADVGAVADLLGTKIVATEFVAYVKLTTEYQGLIEPRSFVLATYALTGFANFGSVGILLGGLGGMAPERRGDLARLGTRALFGGFVATLINASIASLLI